MTLAMLKAIACAKKKNDRLDATKISDLLRCDLLPRCYLAPPALRELWRVLRYRNLLVGEAVRMKNKISGLLMEVGEPYDAQRLHGRRYFYSYLDSLHDTPESGGKTQRGPLSKQRNKHLQRVLIEAAKLAPRWNPQQGLFLRRLEGRFLLGVGFLAARGWGQLE